ncbi:hypothetical protein [Phenylobacterium sp.]|uniref:hypothetical protein n=1 Tax=Phenylobacterium sp. TaxID=1871053 RepID=UPI003BA994F3
MSAPQAEAVVLSYMEAFRSGDIVGASQCYAPAYVLASDGEAGLSLVEAVAARIAGLHANTIGRGLGLEISNLVSVALGSGATAVGCELLWQGPSEHRRQEVTYLLTQDGGWRICAVLPGRLLALGPDRP